MQLIIFYYFWERGGNAADEAELDKVARPRTKWANRRIFGPEWVN
jgi:hypothetical protein